MTQNGQPQVAVHHQLPSVLLVFAIFVYCIVFFVCDCVHWDRRRQSGQLREPLHCIVFCMSLCVPGQA